jgi:hypothetical protein
MSNIITAGDWSKIIAAFGSGGVPLPFVKEIFLMECRIAGTTFVEGISQKTDQIEPGTVLGFIREPDNQHDKLAVMILNHNNEKIGYIPKEKNEVLARLMDGGKLLFGKVESKRTAGNWLQIEVRVYMRDL